MADEAKKPYRITDAFTTPPGQQTKEDRQLFAEMVADLGRRKFYPNTTFVNQHGRETTVKQELEDFRSIFVGQSDKDAKRIVSMSDSELLQYLRESAEISERLSGEMGNPRSKMLHKNAAEAGKRRNVAADRGTGA